MKLAHRLLLLWEALQHRETTFGEVLRMSAECNLDGRLVLAKHFDDKSNQERTA